MNKCKPGDKLVCRDGSVATYLGEATYFERRYMEEYPHNLYRESDGLKWSVTNSGELSKGSQRDRDIVDFYPPDANEIARYQ